MVRNVVRTSITILALFFKMLQGPGNTVVSVVSNRGQRFLLALKTNRKQHFTVRGLNVFFQRLGGVRARRESRITIIRASSHVSCGIERAPMGSVPFIFKDTASHCTLGAPRIRRTPCATATKPSRPCRTPAAWPV